MQLHAEHIVVERGGRTIIDGLSLTVAGGEALVLSGPNGVGKTTLLRALGGFIPLTSGRLMLTGGDSEQSLAEHAHSVGHANAVKANLTVGENAQFWSEYLGGAAGAEDRARAALLHFGLDGLADYPAAYLSAGQRRRLGLARVLAAHRPIWLLDEPTVSLDTASAERLAEAVNSHTASGGIAIVASHVPIGLTRARALRLSGLEQSDMTAQTAVTQR